MLEKQLRGNKNITISDLKVFGFVAGFIAAALNIDIRKKTVAIFCDNTLTVRWVHKMASKLK